MNITKSLTNSVMWYSLSAKIEIAARTLHPAARSTCTEVNMTILSQPFVCAAIDAEKAGIQYPINFEDVWQALGYSRTNNAKRRLVSACIENEDYIIDTCSLRSNVSTTRVLSIQEQSLLTIKEVIKLSVEGFKAFCLVSETDEGREVRKYFIDAERAYRKQLEIQFASQTIAYPTIQIEQSLIGV